MPQLRTARENARLEIGSHRGRNSHRKPMCRYQPAQPNRNEGPLSEPTGPVSRLYRELVLYRPLFLCVVCPPPLAPVAPNKRLC